MGVTLVKAAHIVELQNAVATLRANNQLTAFIFTDAALAAGATVKAVHITELRTALDAVFTKRGRTVVTYTDPDRRHRDPDQGRACLGASPRREAYRVMPCDRCGGLIRARCTSRNFARHSP